MRPFQIFASMDKELALGFFQTLHKETPGAFLQCVGLAAAAMKARPVFLQKQPFERRAEAARRALARVASDTMAEEMLAVYFLERRRGLLVEWLDLLGLEHEDGGLKGDPEAPPDAKLGESVETYRNAASDEDRADRELLLIAFAAQMSIDWPALDALLEA